jgi:hypothetical protein
VGKENLRKIFGPVKENGAWGIRNIQEWMNLYRETDIISEIRKRWLRWLWLVARVTEERNVQKSLIISGVPRGGFIPPSKIPKFWQSWAEFQVQWNIHPQQPNQNTSFTHLKIEWNPWLGGYCPQIPVLCALRPQLNLLNPRQNSWVRHC